MSITELVDLFNELINGSNYEALVSIIVLIVSIWLFKEFRKNKLECDNNDLQRINEALGLYSKALSTINKLENEHFDITLLYDDLYMLYKYSPKNIIAKIEAWLSDDNRNTLSLKKMLKEEIDYLKSLQYDRVSFRLESKFIQAIEYYYHKNNFSSFIIPIINTGISICSILILILYILTFNSASISAKLSITVFFSSLIISAFLLMSIVDLIATKKFKYSIPNVLAAMTLLSLFITSVITQINIIYSAIHISFTWIYLIFIFKRSIK